LVVEGRRSSHELLLSEQQNSLVALLSIRAGPSRDRPMPKGDKWLERRMVQWPLNPNRYQTGGPSRPQWCGAERRIFLRTAIVVKRQLSLRAQTGEAEGPLADQLHQPPRAAPCKGSARAATARLRRWPPPRAGRISRARHRQPVAKPIKRIGGSEHEEGGSGRIASTRTLRSHAHARRDRLYERLGHPPCQLATTPPGAVRPNPSAHISNITKASQPRHGGTSGDWPLRILEWTRTPDPPPLRAARHPPACQISRAITRPHRSAMLARRNLATCNANTRTRKRCCWRCASWIARRQFRARQLRALSSDNAERSDSPFAMSTKPSWSGTPAHIPAANSVLRGSTLRSPRSLDPRSPSSHSRTRTDSAEARLSARNGTCRSAPRPTPAWQAAQSMTPGGWTPFSDHPSGAPSQSQAPLAALTRPALSRPSQLPGRSL